MSNLPEGWVTTTLSQIASWGSGGTPSRSNPNYYGGGIPWLKTGELGQRFVSSTQETISEEGLKNSSAKLFPAGAVAIAMYGATIGKTSILCIDATTNQACAVGIPNTELTSKEYLYHYLCSQKEAFVEAGKGGAQPNISQAVIKDWEVPLAPINEQKRIADKLDAVLERVDACRDRLDRIPVILKRFRQSVLAAATSGKLTEEWREESNAADWKQTDVQTVAHVGTGSTPLRSNSSFFASTGTPWITSAATSQALVTDAGEFVTQAAITAHRLKTYPIGTLLVAMYGEGKTRGQVTELGIPATINQACAAIVVNEEMVIKNYLKLALQANYFEMRELAEGGNQPNLNLSKIKEFPLPLPSMEEQTEIVRRVESLLAYADRLEARYAAARAQVEKLTPATLAKAFRGELVPQDPNDEPASVLLERIREQRNEPKAGKPSRGRRVQG
jgi:type I restriction enzyme S subunit